jgi:hypothetical protein
LHRGGSYAGRSLDLPKPPAVLRIGRDAGCQLVIDQEGVCAEHVELVHDLDGVLVRSLSKDHPIRVQGVAITERRLRDADELTIGATRILFEEPADAPMAALAGEPDRTLSAPPPSASKAPSSAEPETLELQSQPPEPGRAAPKPAGLDADLLIYGLAAVVIVFSVFGLLLLSR